jgi:hypothetical protein
MIRAGGMKIARRRWRDRVRAGWPPRLSRRRALTLLLAAGVVLPAPVAAHVVALPILHRIVGTASADDLLTGDDGAVRIAERGYRLAVDPASGMVTVATADGREYTDFPLAMVGGRTLPSGRRVTRRNGDSLESRLLGAGGRVLEQAVLEPSAQSFTVRFSALPGLVGAASPRFLDDGVRGLDLAGMLGGFTPDPTLPALTALPAVGVTGRTPFAPPPFDIEVQAPPGWMGIGLVQVPSATTLRLMVDGGVAVDYPPALVARGADLGAGTAVGGLVPFPDLLVTFAADPYAGLRAYHDALVPRGEATAAAPPGSRPAWWSEPMVDTWGEQMATHAARSSPLYTADWVRQLAAQWRRRFGVSAVTLVIDSRWQARIGDPDPDPVRFGGLAGMRTLISDLHAQGDHVLLWWPMWAWHVAHVPPSTATLRAARADQIVDPTASAFDAAATSNVATLLGDGPDQLGADGLKLDWGYDIPRRLADPGRGWGAAALHRYLRVLHTAAHAVRPDALVDASAVAPQFAAVADSVRLYDAWSEADWNRRALVVSAVDPDSLIDGDGWQATAASMVTHTVASTVYGTPALYFVTRLANGTAIPPALAQDLGAVVGLSGDKGQGRARSLGGGDWAYLDPSGVTARSFAGSTGLVVWQSSACGTAVSALGGRVVVPLDRLARMVVRDGSGRIVAVRSTAAGLSLTMLRGRPYHLQRPGSVCHPAARGS